MIPQKNAIEIIKGNELKRELGIYGFASDQSPRPKNKTYWRNFLGINVPVYNGAEILAQELNIPVVFSKINRLEMVKIPSDIDYSKFSSLSNESKEKLSSIQPKTLGQASRISGIKPSDISVLMVYLGR